MFVFPLDSQGFLSLGGKTLHYSTLSDNTLCSSLFPANAVVPRSPPASPAGTIPLKHFAPPAKISHPSQHRDILQDHSSQEKHKEDAPTNLTKKKTPNNTFQSNSYGSAPLVSQKTQNNPELFPRGICPEARSKYFASNQLQPPRIHTWMKLR